MQTPESIRARALKLARKVKIGVVIVDYLQLMTGGASDRASTAEQIAGPLALFVPAVAVGGFDEECSAGHEAPDISSVRIVEEGDQLAGGGPGEGVVGKSGKLQAVLLEEAVEILDGGLHAEAQGAESELHDAFHFSEEVILADHDLRPQAGG